MLGFTLKLNLYGKLTEWDFDDIDFDDCGVSIFGFEVMTFCNLLEEKTEE